MSAAVPESQIIDRLRASLFGGDPSALLAVYVYGSAARGELRRDSDLDLAFLGRRSPSRMEVFEAAAELNRVVHREVDLVDLRRAPTVLRAQVVARGRRIHASEPHEVATFEMYALSDYATLEEERKPVIEALFNRYRRG